MPNPAFLLLALAGSIGFAAAADYHVAVNGNDAQNGSASQPFLTIAKASTLLVAGDSCIIHAGTYRETIRPANSGTATNPITYRGAGDGVVTISGADPVGGWSSYSGDIAKAAMAWDLGARANQIFVDGVLMEEARFPNKAFDPRTGFDLYGTPLDQTTVVAAVSPSDTSSGTPATVTAGALSQPAGTWVGATMWGVIGGAWEAQVATVTASAPGQLTVAAKSSPWFPDSATQYGGNGRIYVTGVLAALDSPGEWHYQNGTLYLMTPDRSPPGGHLIEAKRRTLLANLGLRNGIVLSHLGFKAGSIQVTGNDCAVRDCSFRSVVQDIGSGTACRGGLLIGGTRNRMERCLVDGSAGNGIMVQGSYNTVSNCIVRNVNYRGDIDSAIFVIDPNVDGSTHHNTIERCTLSRSGRSLCSPGGATNTVRFNDMSEANLLALDGGIIYNWGLDSKGTEIAYNRLHGNKRIAGNSLAAIYLDDGCKNFQVHHNLCWDVNEGIRLGHWGRPAGGHVIVNNTWWGTLVHGMAQHGSDALTGTVVYNNLSDRSDFLGNDLQNNLAVADARFVAPASGDFRLQADSPAIGYGRVFSPLTDGFVGGAPDAGACEYGATAWVAGADASVGIIEAPPAPSVAATVDDATSATPLLSGVSEPGATITVFDGMTAIATTTADSVSGAWSVRLATPLGVGAHALSWTATNGFGTTTRSPVVTVTVAQLTPNPSPGAASGTGLMAQYFANPTLLGPPALSRVDAGVDFDWGNGSPASAIPSDRFSVRWSGQVEAPTTGDYSFSVTADDGARLWVDGRLLIDQWSDHSPTTFSAVLAGLVAGRRYDLTLEYYENGGGAMARLAWSGPAIALQTVPTSRLYPTAASAAALPFIGQDIGAVGATGSTVTAGGTISVTGAGGDIWWSSDSFHFASQILTGNGVIVARVVSMQNTDPWAKAGVMIRETTAIGSTHAFCCMTPSNGVSFQRRLVTNGPTTKNAGSTATAARWVRMTRQGSTFTSAESADGVSWTTFGTATITMGSSVQVGLAVTSHVTGTRCTAVFDSVVVTPAGVG